MANAPEQPPDISGLKADIAALGLEPTRVEFLTLAEGPDEGPHEGHCWATVCAGLNRTFKDLPFWQAEEPFEKWYELTEEILARYQALPPATREYLYPTR